MGHIPLHAVMTINVPTPATKRALPRGSVMLSSEKRKIWRPVFARKSVKEKHLNYNYPWMCCSK
jgi:hypothetical protein